MRGQGKSELMCDTWKKTKLSLRIHIFHKFQQMYVVNDTSLKPTAL